MILVLYLNRLIFHHIPPNESIVSSFLPLGPTGLGGFAIFKLGVVSRSLFPLLYSSLPFASNESHADMAALALWGVGLASALLLWAVGVWFLLVALASFYLKWKTRELRFNSGWWSFTFPLASLSLSTLLIGKELDSKGFQVTGTIFVVCVVLLVVRRIPLVFLPWRRLMKRASSSA